MEMNRLDRTRFKGNLRFYFAITKDQGFATQDKRHKRTKATEHKRKKIIFAEREDFGTWKH